MIYFIQAGTGGPVKIGFTMSVAARLAQLRTGSHETLTLLAVFLGGKEVEASLHEQFSAHRIRGEWFKPAPELIRYATEQAAAELHPKKAEARQPRDTISAVAAACGGHEIFAAKINAAPSDVERWIGRNVIPYRWRQCVAQAARAAAITLPSELAVHLEPHSPSPVAV